MHEFLLRCVSIQVLPATILLTLALIYWLFVLFGALDLDLFDFDVDVDGEADMNTMLSIGLVPLRFLNLGRVPLMLWVSFFALCLWVLSMMPYLDWLGYKPFEIAVVNDLWKFVADVVLSLGLAKLATQPLNDKFDTKPPNPAKEIVGKTCEIATLEVTPNSGQAKLATEGAPLLLNVRTRDGTLTKGEQAKIVEHVPEQNIYIVCKANLEV